MATVLQSNQAGMFELAIIPLIMGPSGSFQELNDPLAGWNKSFLSDVGMTSVLLMQNP